MKGPISLADALRAIATLRPGDDATVQAIREMLGVEGDAPTAPAQPAIGEWKPSSSASTAAVRPPALDAGTRRAARVATARPSADAVQVLRRLPKADAASGASARPLWLDLPGDALGPASAAADAPAPPPLFGPPRGRAILASAIATTIEDGDLDVGRAVDAVAQCRPLDVLPRLPVPTLRRGVQVLFDIARSMDPFHADFATLRDSLDDILGDDRLEVLHFVGCPARGAGAGARSEWPNAWQPPAAGTPVLAVTDLGIGGSPFDEDRPDIGEWLRFARRVHADGYVLMALVPYEAARWPAVLARAMTLLHWSERTTIGEVKRALRRAYGRMR